MLSEFSAEQPVGLARVNADHAYNGMLFAGLMLYFSGILAVIYLGFRVIVTVINPAAWTSVQPMVNIIMVLLGGLGLMTVGLLHKRLKR